MEQLRCEFLHALLSICLSYKSDFSVIICGSLQVQKAPMQLLFSIVERILDESLERKGGDVSHVCTFQAIFCKVLFLI